MLKLFFFYVHATVFTVYSFVVLRVVYDFGKENGCIVHSFAAADPKCEGSIYLLFVAKEKCKSYIELCSLVCTENDLLTCWKLCFLFPKNSVSLTHRDVHEASSGRVWEEN